MPLSPGWYDSSVVNAIQDRSAPARGQRGFDPISLLAIATFLVWADRQMVAPVLPAMARDFHTGIGAVAAVVSVYSLCYGAFEIAYGQLADRYGRVRVMALALQVFGIGTLGAGLMPTLPWVIALRGLTGAAAAAIVPLSLTYIGDTVRLERRQLAIGRINTANAIGQASSVVLGGIFAQLSTWRALFVVYGLASTVVAFILRRAPESSPGGSDQPVLRTMGQVLRAPGVGLLYGIAFIEGGTILGAFVYLSPQLKSAGYSYLTVGLVMAVFGLTVLLGTRLLPALQRRLSRVAPVWMGGAAIALGYAAPATGAGIATGLVCSSLLGLAYAWFHSGMQTWATVAFPPARATTVSGYAFWLFVGAGVATQLLIPLAAAGDYRRLFLISALAGALITVVGSLALRRHALRPADPSPST